MYRDGDSDSALRLVATGAREAEHNDPVWNWKFRILEAQLLIRRHAAEKSAVLLSTKLPDDLPVELQVEKRIVEGVALCNSGTPDVGALFDAADRLIPSAHPLLRSQLAFSRAECEYTREPASARAHYLESAKLAQNQDGFLAAISLGSAAYLLMQDRRYDEALQEFKSAIDFTDSPFLKQNLLGNIGYCYEQLGDWILARANLEQAERVAAGVKDATADRALWLIDLGLERFSQLQYKEAKDFFSRALPIASQLHRKDLAGQALNNLAWVALVTKDRESARQYLRQSEELHLQGGPYFFLLLSKARLARMNGQLSEAESLLKEILTSNPLFDARWQALTDLATIYSDEQRYADAEATFAEAAKTAEKSFEQVTSDEFRISLMDRNPFYDQYIRFLVGRNRPLDALAIAERGRSPALAEALHLPTAHRKLNLSGLQRSLRSQNSVVLAYWLAWDTESYLWVINPSGVRLVKLPPEKEIADAVDAYKQEVLDISTPEESRLGQKLYQMLVAPAEKYVPPGSKVIIVPHRRLYKLNFETLVSPHPKPHFWIEDVCIQNASFLAVLEKPRREERRYTKDLLLMGAPVQASKDFPGLAHAPEEMQKVAAHFQHAKETVIEGAQATPPAYDASDPREYRFFHFVTHGTASDTNPLDSAIILSPSNDGYKLYARDIIKTKINPELVTISTCYGAGTRQYSGEGLVGLAWAFMRVGAHQVVAALWEVDDAANADLMDQFYSELTKGKTAAAALRDGKLAMLHSKGPRRKPYYWASLQIYTGP